MAKKSEKTEDKTLVMGESKVKNLEGVDYFVKVKLRALEGAKNHTPGSVFEGSEVLARFMVENGTAERV